MLHFHHTQHEILITSENHLDMLIRNTEYNLCVPNSDVEKFKQRYSLKHIEDLELQHVKDFKQQISIENHFLRNLQCQNIYRPLPPKDTQFDTFKKIDIEPREAIRNFESQHEVKQVLHQLNEDVLNNFREMKKRVKKHYVYHLIDPAEEVFYVGYTSHPLTRLAWHWVDGLNYPDSSGKCSAARLVSQHIKRQEYFFMYIASTHETEEEALLEEKKSISYYSDQICNIKDNYKRLLR